MKCEARNFLYKLADGFATMESENLRVFSLKINSVQLAFLKELDVEGIETGYVWGANLSVDNELKNPVILGSHTPVALEILC